MIPNNNVTVLPFYDALEKQNHRKYYAFGSIYQLVVPGNMLLPFQIVRPTSAQGTSYFDIKVYDKNGVFIKFLQYPMIDAGMRIKRFESLGYDVIFFPGNLMMNYLLADGIYYFKFYDGTNTWYSEMFMLLNDTVNYTLIEWSDSEDLIFNGGRIVYGIQNYKNRLYIDTQIGKPEYKYEEEIENRDGFSFHEKQISEKIFKFTFLAPEYLLDALRIVRLSDFVTIVSQGQTYTADSFLMTPKWQTQGDLASVECEFECDTIIKKIGRGLLPQNLPEFNNDFNNDFNID